ncbi:MAG: metalloregulator ArsR/SmtB family transcription factor [Ignavibacteriales bacterium]|nr:metalloregulator ArsR/SmtB family transcription factor [Ignavibacteriales bacterium]
METKIDVLKALGDETRLRIINLFIKRGQILCVCELMDALKIPQYAVSKALTIIKNADLLTAEKKGTWVYYELNKSIVQNKNLFTFLKSYLNDEIFSVDELRLKERLLLREGNKCVVGIIPETDLKKKIKQKAEA